MSAGRLNSEDVPREAKRARYEKSSTSTVLNQQVVQDAGTVNSASSSKHFMTGGHCSQQNRHILASTQQSERASQAKLNRNELTNQSARPKDIGDGAHFGDPSFDHLYLHPNQRHSQPGHSNLYPSWPRDISFHTEPAQIYSQPQQLPRQGQYISQVASPFNGSGARFPLPHPTAPLQGIHPNDYYHEALELPQQMAHSPQSGALHRHHNQFYGAPRRSHQEVQQSLQSSFNPNGFLTQFTAPIPGQTAPTLFSNASLPGKFHREQIMSEHSCSEHLGMPPAVNPHFRLPTLSPDALTAVSNAERANSYRNLIINGIWSLNLKERKLSEDVEHHRARLEQKTADLREIQDAIKEENEKLERQESHMQERGYKIDLSNPLVKNSSPDITLL